MKEEKNPTDRNPSKTQIGERRDDDMAQHLVSGQPESQFARRLSVDYKTIPGELRQHDQWVVWRHENVTKSGKTRRRKVPISPATGKNAKVNESRTWTSFEKARLYLESRPDSFDGLGFVFSDNDQFIGIDLDNCIVDYSLSEFAKEVIDTIGSYTEISPSGTGIKCFAKTTIPIESFRNDAQKIEVYGYRRFFTVTGWRTGHYSELFDRTHELSCLCEKLRPAPQLASSPPGIARPAHGVSDETIIARALAAKNGLKFRMLFLDGASLGNTASEDDLALCAILAFWAGPDSVQIDRIFRKSRLYRPKWDARHYANGRTYGAETVRRAIALQNGVHYSWPQLKHNVAG